MHAGINHEIILSGDREAKMVVHLLNEADRSDLVEFITPNLENKKLNFLEYLKLLNSRKNESNEYVIPVENAAELLLTLGSIAVPCNSATENFSPEHFVGARLLRFISTVREDAPYAVNVIPDYGY